MKLSELKSHDEVSRARRGWDLRYALEADSAKLAGDVSAMIVGYRARRGLTQRQLADELDWKQPAVARLERGDHEPTISTLTILARAGVIHLELGRSGPVVSAPVSKRAGARPGAAVKKMTSPTALKKQREKAETAK